MSDNVAITPGTGASAATDNIGGVHYQRVKPTWGADGTANDVSTANPLPTAPKSGTMTDGSGTITTGGTAQNALASNTTRAYLYVDNPLYKSDGTTANTAERLCFRTDAAAGLGAGSFCLYPGEDFEFNGGFCPTGAVSVIAATTGHAFTVKEG